MTTQARRTAQTSEVVERLGPILVALLPEDLVLQWQTAPTPAVPLGEAEIEHLVISAVLALQEIAVLREPAQAQLAQAAHEPRVEQLRLVQRQVDARVRAHQRSQPVAVRPGESELALVQPARGGAVGHLRGSDRPQRGRTPEPAFVRRGRRLTLAVASAIFSARRAL